MACKGLHCEVTDCDRWFEEGAEFGFGEMETLVPPPGAAEKIKEWLEEEKEVKKL